MPPVNPAILIWARETAGLSLEQAAKALQLNDTKSMTGAQRLLLLERGDLAPPRTLLKRMADKYRRPLVAFYLSGPPPIGDRGEDFRRAPDSPPPDFNPDLDALIRDIRARHDLVKSLLEDEEAETVTNVGTSTIKDGVSAVTERIKSTIEFDLVEFRSKRNVKEAFTYLRNLLERHGIFVILMGDLGSHHSKISATIFRGYCIADPIAPFIVINDNDADAAWSFTALHESAHLWLGQSGVSGASSKAKVERFCNDVASRILLPPAEIRKLGDLGKIPFEGALTNISEFASERNISRRMVAYQLLRSDMINNIRYDELIGRFQDDWVRSKLKKREEKKDGQGPNRYVVLRHRLGPALIDLAKRSVDTGVLSPTKASRLLGVKPVSVRAFLRPHLREIGNADAVFD